MADSAATGEIRKIVVYREEILTEAGKPADGSPLVKVVAAAVVRNSAPGVFQEDVLENVPFSVTVGEELTSRVLELIGPDGVASYGKGAIVGTDGDQEQGVSFLTTAFGNTLRDAVAGSEWVSSVTKRGAPGSSIDIPLASKDYIWARSHYDAATISIPDAPAADEVVIVIAAASRGRLNERCGGQTVDDKPAR